MDRIRELLGRAKQQQGEAFSCLDTLKASIDQALQAAEQTCKDTIVIEGHPVPYPIRRRHLLTQIGLKSKRYGLTNEVQAFVYAAGYELPQELSSEQLEKLHGWLVQWSEAGEMACDTAYELPR